MGKAIKIFLGIVIGIIVLLIASYFYIAKSSTNVARLNIESGEVMINSGNGFVLATDGMKLKLETSIKTGAEGRASVVLYESAIISLEPNTEIKIANLAKENIQIEQNSGSTWNKFTGLLGLTGMSIKTPNTVATVRGTSWGVSLNEIMVGEGLVEVKKGENTEEVGEGEAIDFEGEEFLKRNLSPAEKAKIIEKIKKHIEILKKIRVDEVGKKKFLVEKLMSANNLSYNNLEKYLEDLDSGEGDLSELSNRIPIKLDFIEKIIGLTEKIREEKQLILRLSK